MELKIGYNYMKLVMELKTAMWVFTVPAWFFIIGEDNTGWYSVKKLKAKKY